jgi:hypothetical protein
MAVHSNDLKSCSPVQAIWGISMDEHSNFKFFFLSSNNSILNYLKVYE